METSTNNMTHSVRKPIISLGELLIDLIPGVEGMRISDPGPVIKTASGSAGIFACAGAALGGRCGFIGKVGIDSLSAMVLEVLSRQGVDVSHVTISPKGQIGLAFLEYLPEGRHYQYYRKTSIGSQLGPQDLSEAAIAGAYAVHFPGMLLELTPQMREACGKLVALARKHHVLVSFDPNIRREIASDEAARQRLMDAVRSADVIAPTLAEGQTITGKDSVGSVLRALHAMGPRVVALTRDANGAVLSKDGQVVIAHGIDVPVVDPTGAGDTFAAALCVGLQENMPLDRLAMFCNCAGTLVVTKIGTIGLALPDRAEVEEMMASGVCVLEHKRLEDME